MTPLTAQVAALQKQVDDLQASLARWESRAARWESRATDWETVFAALGREGQVLEDTPSRPQLQLVQGGAL